MSRIFDPTDPCAERLPTLQERRRSVRERLAKAQANHEKFTLALTCPLSPAAVSLALYMQAMAATEIRLLNVAIDYLGEPDPRLDLYRIFSMNLPPE
jgi:hypothetical protein